MIGYRQVDANLKKVYEEDETGQKENIYYRTAENSCQKYIFGRMYGECPVVDLWETEIIDLDILISPISVKLSTFHDMFYSCRL